MFGSKNIDNNYFIPLYRNVKSGDPDNCEATAAYPSIVPRIASGLSII